MAGLPDLIGMGGTRTGFNPLNFIMESDPPLHNDPPARLNCGCAIGRPGGIDSFVLLAGAVLVGIALRGRSAGWRGAARLFDRLRFAAARGRPGGSIAAGRVRIGMAAHLEKFRAMSPERLEKFARAKIARDRVAIGRIQVRAEALIGNPRARRIGYPGTKDALAQQVEDYVVDETYLRQEPAVRALLKVLDEKNVMDASHPRSLLSMTVNEMDINRMEVEDWWAGWVKRLAAIGFEA